MIKTATYAICDNCREETVLVGLGMPNPWRREIFRSSELEIIFHFCSERCSKEWNGKHTFSVKSNAD